LVLLLLLEGLGCLLFPDASVISSSPLVPGHSACARFFRSGLLGVTLLLLMIDVVGGLLGLFGLPGAWVLKVDKAVVLLLIISWAFRLSKE
jgi:hypothetical protein